MDGARRGGAAAGRDGLAVVRKTGSAAGRDSRLEAALIFTAGIGGDVLEGWVAGVEFGPDITGFYLEGLDGGVETADASDILAVGHGDVRVTAGVGEGMVEELAKARAAGKSDQEYERDDVPLAGESCGSRLAVSVQESFPNLTVLATGRVGRDAADPHDMNDADQFVDHRRGIAPLGVVA